MISKFIAYLSVFLMVSTLGCLALNDHRNEEEINESKPKYILKCFSNKNDCTMFELLPNYSTEINVNIYSTYFYQI